ncbi:hypothetical protein [Aquiflexum sp.]|uniref:hypothetical protein n=1 Tax=Aquiflexum sp. TaxID=1872584 RepID=UPI0035939B93
MPNLLPIFALSGELTSDKKLADKDLLEKPVIHQASQSFPIESDKLPLVFSISAQGQLSVNLFNDENDKDDLDLVGTAPEAGLQFDPAKEAYLKYDIQVFPKCKLSVAAFRISVWISTGKRESGRHCTETYP